MAIGSGARLLNSCHTDHVLFFVAESAHRYISVDPFFNYSNAELKIKLGVSFVSKCHLNLFPFGGYSCLQ